jgi:5-hydroxyisourate hydrolase
MIFIWLVKLNLFPATVRVNSMLKMLLPLIGLGFSSWCFAQNPLSVHVLNLENGLPSANVKVTLEAQQNDKWTEISSSTTDDQGRINDLYPKDTALQKVYTKLPLKRVIGFAKKISAHSFQKCPWYL